jgi:hypothetical protein
MALLFMDSWDHYVTADLPEKWTATGATGTSAAVAIVAGAGRRSSSGLRWTLGTASAPAGYCQKVLSPTGAACIMGFSISAPSGFAGTAQGLQIASLRDIAALQVSLRANADMTLSVLRGTTVLGTTTNALPVSTAAYVEWKVVIDNAAGSVEVRINGATGLSLAAQDTQQTATTGWTSVVLGQIDALANSGVGIGGASKTFDYDDLYVLDGSGAAPWNAFLGDLRVDVRVPTGAGTTTGWTPSAGANWQNVDDAAPDDDTTYNGTATVDAIDTFVVQDAAVAGATIYGVQQCLSMKKMDAGTCTVAPVIRHSGTNLVGAAIAPGTTYAYSLIVHAANPGTAAPWTEADFNAAEFGYKKVS